MIRDLEQSEIAAETGMAALVAAFVLLLVSLLGGALLNFVTTDRNISDNYRNHTVAFYAADAGLEQLAYDLQDDRHWLDGVLDDSGGILEPFPGTVSIGDTVIELDVDHQGNGLPGWYPYRKGVSLEGGDATFSLEIYLPPKDPGAHSVTIEMRSVGSTVGSLEPSTVTLLAEGRVGHTRGESVWDNIIFADVGATGGQINGHVDVHGSIHVIGDPDDPPTIEMSGRAGIHNNYAGLAGAVRRKLPTPPTTTVDGEEVETLNAEVYLGDTYLRLKGAAQVGRPENGANRVKDTVDAVYADPGTISPADNVHADRWTEPRSRLSYPRLDSVYTDDGGTQWASHTDYLDARALTIPVSHLSKDTPSFAYSDASGNSVAWDRKSGALSIAGLVRVDGDLELGSRHSGVNYRGTGTVYATGDVVVSGDVMPVGDYLGAGADDGNLGLIAGGDVSTSSSNKVDVIAAVYAAGNVRVLKQSVIAGAIVASSFDLGTNPPTVAHVPILVGNLPPALPGGGAVGYLVTAFEFTGWYEER